MLGRMPAAFRAVELLRSQTSGYDAYGRHPNAYARRELGVRHWSTQRLIARLLLTPPYRVLVKAAHKVGKTHLGGSLTNWWYDTFNPGLVLTTAPTDRQVRDLLWKEVRVQRRGRPGFRGPKMPRLESAPDHFAHGYTARDSDAFQGQHSPHTLIIFDEGVGVAAEFWEAAESMFGGQGHAWLVIFNPTNQSSQAYLEERKRDKDGRPAWHVVSMPATSHPNIVAELEGRAPPFPSAIRLARLDELLRSWSTPLSPDDRPTSLDVEWPPGSGQYLHPGPVAEARLLARWPSQAINAVWSESAWMKAEHTILPAPKSLPEYGVDVARFGDDFTSIHGKRGGTSHHHESHNGWSLKQTLEHCKNLARADAARFGVSTKRIIFKVDYSGGMGAGITDHAGPEFTFLPVNVSEKALNEEGYPNKRSELWFAVAELAANGFISLARLPAWQREELRRQALSPTYTLDIHGRRVVESKKDTKARLGRSPDDMDAVNLAYAVVKPGGEQVIGQIKSE